MIVVFAVAILCLLCVLVYGFVQLRNLIVFEKENYPVEWESDGSPEFFLLGGNFAVSACGLCWLFLTPDWARSQKQTAHYLKQFRVCVLIWNVGIVLFAWAAARIFG